MAALNKITAPQVSAKLDDHLQKHEDVYYPMLKKHDKALFGADGDDGLCLDVKNMILTIKMVGIPILIALIINIVAGLIK